MDDLRFGLRALRRTPGFTIAAALCLALGIGANTAIFSVIDAVLLRPLPYTEPSRLVMIWESNAARNRDRNVVAQANYLDWRAQSRTFSEIAAAIDWRVGFTGTGEPEQLQVEYATASFFSVLGRVAELGRVYTAAEDAPRVQRVVVISHALWERLFNGDRGAIGRSMTLNGRPHVVIGVMPADFALPGRTPDLWLPLALDPSVDYRVSSGRSLFAIGRLAPGVTLEQARVEMTTIARRLEMTYPVFNAGWSVNLVPLTEQVVGDVRRALAVLAGVVGFVLLIACANVANLQLARATAREREIAVRAALGAGRNRLIRLLITESVALGCVGGALGLVLAVWGTQALVAAAPASLPRVADVGINGRAFAVTFVLSILTGLVFGLAPAVHATRVRLHDSLKEGSRGSVGRGNRTRAGLVASQVALSMVLLVGAGLMLRSFARLSAVNPGFDPDHVLSLRVELSGERYRAGAAQAAFYEQVVARVRAIPGVAAASAIDWLPMSGLGTATSYFVEGAAAPDPGDRRSADIRGVEYDLFRTLRMPIRRGRAFTAEDRDTVNRSVVINETLARTVFPGEDPIGRHLLMPWGDTLRGEIVGIVGDAKYQGLDSIARPMIYWPIPQFPRSFMSLVVRTTVEPMAVASAVRAAIHERDATLAVAEVRPLDAVLGNSVERRRFNTVLIGLFAAVALVLAAIGIYGVLAYSVSQRTREIGLRIALGAREGRVLALVLGEGMRIVVVGLGVGIAGAFALTRLMRGLLFDITPTDPVTFAAVSVVLCAVAALASYLPARRAARVDPMEALRAE